MAAESGLLAEMVLALHASLSRTKTISAVLQGTRKLFPADDSAVLLVLRTGDYEWCTVSRPPDGRLKRTRVKPQKGFEDWVLSTGQALLFPGAASVLPDPRLLAQQSFLPAERLMAAPLINENRTLGVLLVGSMEDGPAYAPEQLQLLQGMAQHASLALGNAEAFSTFKLFRHELQRQVKATTRQLRLANEALRQADLAKSEMISIVAHELRTPITSILGFAKLMLKGKPGPLTEEQLQFCRIIFKNSENLERLITDMLDITKIELGRMELQHEKHSFNLLLKESLLTLEAARPAEERRIKVDLPAENLWIRGDRLRLVQVVNNLLSNAQKYSPPETPINLSVATSEGYLTFSVENFGQALTAEQRSRVFDKFYRVKNISTQAVSGSGLGLAIAKKIVELHGGTIWAENAGPDKNIFRFTLPRIQPPEAVSAQHGPEQGKEHNE